MGLLVKTCLKVLASHKRSIHNGPKAPARPRKMELRFGKEQYRKIRYFINGMIDATSLALFEEAHDGAKKQLREMKPRSGDAEEELRIFADLRKTIIW